MDCQHERSDTQDDVVAVSFLCGTERQLRARHHQGCPDDRGRQSGHNSISPHEEYDQAVFDQMSPTEEDDPAEQQVGKEQDKPHVKSRYGQNMGDAGDGILLSQGGVDASTFTGYQCGE